MKFCNNSNFTLPKQSQRSRSVLEDGSRSLGLFWTEKSPSYNRRNMVITGTMPVFSCYILATVNCVTYLVHHKKASLRPQHNYSFVKFHVAKKSRLISKQDSLCSMVYGIIDGLNHRCTFKCDLKLVLTLKVLNKNCSRRQFDFLHFYLSKKIRLDFSCESSA